MRIHNQYPKNKMKIRIIPNSVSNFLIPEEKLCAKVIFDNARNYLIAATFFAITNWLLSGAQTSAHNNITGPIPENSVHLLLVIFYLIGGSLLTVSVLQTIEIGRRIYDSICLKIDLRIKNNKMPTFLPVAIVVAILLIVFRGGFIFLAILFVLFVYMIGVTIVTYSAFGVA